MKKLLSLIMIFSLVLSFTGCILQKSDLPCSECGAENALSYKIDHVGKKVLDEKITVSYCEKCYDAYLEETFGKGVRAKAEEQDAQFKDVVGAGGYLDAFE